MSTPITVAHLRYLVPNSFTALSMLFGAYAIALASDGQFQLASWLVLWGVLLDKLDGTAARLCHATSEFGVQYDSFADFVVFGLAPAAILFFALGRTSSGELNLLPTIVAALLIVANSARLARFNVSDTDPPGVFVGIPTTLIGALLASSYLVSQKFGTLELWNQWAPFLWMFGAAAMVSNIRLPKLAVRKNRFVNVFQFANVAAIYVITPFMIYPEYHFALCLLYLVCGIGSQYLKAPSTKEFQHEK